MSTPQYFQDLTKAELANFLLPLSHAKPRYRDGEPESAEARATRNQKLANLRAKQLFNWVYQRFIFNYDDMTDLAKEVRAHLKETLPIFRLREKVSQQAEDGTHKFLWDLPDGKTIESVIIPAALTETEDPAAGDTADMPEENSRFAGARNAAPLTKQNWKRLTACISSQVGCAMACKFCLTGVQGLDRSLKTHEIVTQILELRARAPLTNIVFMGMGEPLNNTENTIKACQIFLDQDGLSFSKRKVTVSTSGLVPGIEKLGQEVDVSLAISLNATTDEIRSEIMPVNKKWNIATLLAAVKKYPLGPHRRVTFEYVLLKGVNDSLEDAARIIALTRNIPSKINLIPFNAHSGSGFQRPSDETVLKFQKYLLDRHLTATVRISRGRDISAACGQLRSLFGTARGTDRHKDFTHFKELPVLQTHAHEST